MRNQRIGRVIAFDPDRGVGEIEDDDGTRLAFHCTQIADGTRAVPVGMQVRYVRTPGSLGAWEASEVAVSG